MTLISYEMSYLYIASVVTNWWGLFNWHVTNSSHCNSYYY